MSNGNLSVTGNIILKKNAKFSVTTGTLTFLQTNFAQYSIKLNGPSQFTMTDSTFITNATIQNSFAMSIKGNDDSVVRIENSNLNMKNGSWPLSVGGLDDKALISELRTVP